jgi:hypothetical protein
MINRTPSQLAALIGRSVMHQHMASDDVCGPVTVIDVHLGSDSVVVSGDVNTGRCYSLPASVTLFHPASATPEPQP